MYTHSGQGLVTDAFTSQPYHHDSMFWDPFHQERDESLNRDKCLIRRTSIFGNLMSVQTGTCFDNSGCADEEPLTPVSPLRFDGSASFPDTFTIKR